MWRCWCGRNWSSQGKTHHGSQESHQLVQTNSIISSTSAAENPGRASLSLLIIRRFLSRPGLHASLAGTGANFILFLTKDLVGNCILGVPHSSAIFLSVLPKTVRWSCWWREARNFTGNLLLFWRDWWKLVYLLQSIVLGWRDSDNSSIKYLWVHLSTLKQILIATFQEL